MPGADSPGPGERRCGIYVRVSGDGQTYENQQPELLDLARVRRFTVTHSYQEVVSAAKRRPEFDRMMADARAGRFDVLLIWALDRFGRSMIGNLSAVLELDRVGVQVISVRESWLDTSSPVRSLLIAIFSWVAEQERLRLIERTRAGLERARREGRTLGAPASRWTWTRPWRFGGGASRSRALPSGLASVRSTLARALAAYTSTLARIDPLLLARIGPPDPRRASTDGPNENQRPRQRALAA